MRVAKYNEAKAARGSKLLNVFHEVMRARMLWASGGVALIGVMAGFVFYSNRSQLQLQNPTPPTQQEVSATQTPVAPTTVALNEEQPVETIPQTDKQSTQVLAAATCSSDAQAQATNTRDDKLKAEDERYQDLMNKRRGLKQLLSAITGSSVSAPSAEEIHKHESIVAQINQTYTDSLTTAHCL